MNKICTDIKQSRKLIELGLNSTTSDMTYYPLVDSAFYELKCKSRTNENDVPAWSLSRLFHLLPSNVTFMQKDDGKYYACLEMDNDDLKEEARGEFGSVIHSSSGIDAVDVVFDLMVWYLKNREL